MNKLDFINLELTQQKFSYKSQKFKKTDPVIVLCSVCSTAIEVRYDSIRNRRGKAYNPICRSCKQKKTWRETDLKDKISTKISAKMQEIWNNDKYLENQRKKHSIIGKEKWKNPEYAAKVSRGVKKAHRNIKDYTEIATAAMHTEQANKHRKATLVAKRKCPEYRAKLSEASKKNWEDPGYRERMLAIFTSEEFVAAQIASHTTPEYLALASQIARDLHSTEEYRIKMMAGIKALWDNDAYRTKMHHILTSKEFKEKQIASHSSDGYRVRASAIAKQLWQDPDYRAKVLAAVCTFWDDPEYRHKQITSHNTKEYKQKCSDMVKALWEDPEYHKRHVEASKEQWNDPEYREAISAFMVALWEDPIYRKTITESSKEQWNNPEYRETITESSKERWNNPEYRKRQLEASKALWNDPEYRETMSATIKALWEDPIYRKTITESSKEQWNNPEYRKRQIEIRSTEEYREKMAVIRAAQPRISSIQLWLYRYLDDLDVEYYCEGNNTKIGYYVFDCLIPRQGDVCKNLLIECQGDYWHSLPHARSNDRAKFTYIDRYFPEHEIMYIWEHEFYAKDRVLDRLKLKLGIGIETVDFNFSDLSVCDISSKDVGVFLDAYHYIGKGRGGRCVGAFLDSELIACAVVGPPVRQKMRCNFSDIVELSRLCIHPSYHKKNFASWFVSRVVRDCDKPVIAFADTTVGHTGIVYKAANFVLDHEVPPDYWYVDRDGFVMHKKTLYQRARRMKMVERQFAQANNYTKQWGGKKLCYLYAR